MNLRQAQRALADLMAKCQEARVQLPIVRVAISYADFLDVHICLGFANAASLLGFAYLVGQDPLDGLYEAGKALRHSQQNDKLELEDALDELKQIFGVDPVWLQHEQEEQTKRANRQKRGRKPKPLYNDADAARKGARSMSVSSASSSGASGPETGDPAAAMSKDKDKAATSQVKRQPASQPESSKPQQQQRKSPPPPKSRVDTIKQQNPAKVSENQELANEFVELGGYELKHGEKQKGISRMNVAKQIRNTPAPLKSGAQARQIPGIGPSAAAKVDEILHHGKMRALEKYESSRGDEEDGDGNNEDKEDNAQEV